MTEFKACRSADTLAVCMPYGHLGLGLGLLTLQAMKIMTLEGGSRDAVTLV